MTFIFPFFLLFYLVKKCYLNHLIVIVSHAKNWFDIPIAEAASSLLVPEILYSSDNLRHHALL